MVLRLFLLVFLLVLLGNPEPLRAADNGESAKNGAETEVLSFPGLNELGARSAALGDFVVRAEERLQRLAELERLQETLTELQGQFKKINQEMQPLGPPESWYVDRLNNYLSQFAQVRQGLDGLQQRLATRQLDVENVRDQVLKDQEFWSAWEKELKKQAVELPKQTISQVHDQLNRLQKGLKAATEKLLQLQEKIGLFQRELLLAYDQLSNALSKLRKATFRRNAYSFFSRDYYRQFNSQLITQMNEGVQATLRIDRRYLQENAWLGGMLAGIFLFCTVFLRHYRAKLKITEDWHFILKRPLAAAGFITVALCWYLLPALPPLLRFLLESLAVISATALALALMESRRQMQLLILAAALFLVTSLLQLSAFPQPLFRLYISLLTLILVPVLYRQIEQSRTLCVSPQGRVFRALLRLAIVVLSISLLAQVAGYMNFSIWLIQATFETGMVLLFVRMAVLLLSGAIDLGNELLVQSGRKFFQEFGGELTLRLKRLLKFLLYSLALFYLLPIWRLFATAREGLNFFGDLAINIGNFHLTLHMAVSALFAFYLALQISWVLQTVTESQLLRKRKADRGVEDAVKKLIHYGIVLVGFLLALSMLGMGIQNFVVLLGAFGVGIGFGLQDIVNNFLSGLILLFERPIKVGDGVLIDGEYGTVIRIGMRSTVVQNLDEAELIVPNSHMISQKVTNWTLSNRRVRIVVPVGVAYGSDLEKVLAILSEAGQQHPDVLGLPKPTPLFMQFGASSLDFELRVWISNVDNRPRIKNELLLYIDRRFREENIEIPFSQHDLHIRTVASGIIPELPGKEG